MSTQDFYSILGVSKGVSQDEIKNAFRKKAIKLHPDRHVSKSEAERKQFEEQFQEVQKAYNVLSDPEKRAQYDQFGHEQFTAQGSGNGGFNPHDFGDIFTDLGSIFGDMFGRRNAGRGTRMQQGSDLRYTLTLDLGAAIFGYQTVIQVPRLGQCKHCHGSGAKGNAKPVSCNTCGGMGQVYLQHGALNIQQTCPDCRGQGERIHSPCPACRGTGQVRETKAVQVNIPVGVDEGDQIRLANEGEAGVRGGASGDLYIQIHFNTHKVFKRRAQDLYAEMPIDYLTAALGGDIEIPTLEGKVRLHVPEGTPNGKTLKLKGKGIPGTQRRLAGDLYLTLAIETPVNLRQEQIELLKKLEASFKQNKHHYPRMKQWVQDTTQFFSHQSS